MGDDRDRIVEAVTDGMAELWRVDNGAAYLVTGIDRDELVVMCCEGRGASEIADAVVAAARRRGLSSIRFHTRRPGLARLLSRYCTDPAEHVYRMQLDEPE